MSIHALPASARLAGGLLSGVLSVLGVLVVVAGGATPVLASGRGDEVTCLMPRDRILKVFVPAGAEAKIRRTAAGVIEVNRATCGSWFGAADVWNTRQIQVRSGSDGAQKVRIDLANGGFAPGYGDEAGQTDEIEFTVLLGKGDDSLAIDGTPAADHIAFGWVPGNMTAIPAINLDAEDADYDVSYLSVESVSAFGHDGNDTLTGNDPSTGRIAWLSLFLSGDADDDQLTGGANNDWLLGGSGDDTFKGGQGNDWLFAMDNAVFTDTLNGGAGTDNCSSDAEDVVAGCEG
ncbi:MAG: hypothetical protein H0W07_08155 [Chloroflexi bacterium]|nr:hypothetical protein [Chloroflexota bacterium]